MTARHVRVGRAGEPQDGRVRVPVVVRTRLFGDLHGTIAFPVERSGETARVAWVPALRLPGLRPGERVHRLVLRRPGRASVLDAAGRRLEPRAGGRGARRRGTAGDDRGSGLEALYDERLGGRPGAELRYGRRRIARVDMIPGRSVKTTIRPALQAVATGALGDRLGGVAVVRPRNGDVLALAGLAVSAPQPPGSVFKIITLSAALQEGETTPGESFPVRSAATLEGVQLRNAGDEQCGGTLTESFAHSCNSVFAPLGARLGAKRLVAYAQRFGFNEKLRIAGFEPGSIPPPRELDRRPRGRGERYRAGSRPRHAAGHGERGGDDRQRRRAGAPAAGAQPGGRAPPRRPAQGRAPGARDDGRGRARRHRHRRGAAGRRRRGQDRHAELVPTADGAADPANTDAWFVAFALPRDPKVAVAVMLVGAGQGGAAAAPVAREVLAAAL